MTCKWSDRVFCNLALHSITILQFPSEENQKRWSNLMAVECVHIHMLQVAQNIGRFCCIFENFPKKRMDLCISKCPADVVTNRDWKIKAFLLDNKSHSLRFQTNSPRRTIHHIRAETCIVCLNLRICAVIFQCCQHQLFITCVSADCRHSRHLELE